MNSCEYTDSYRANHCNYEYRDEFKKVIFLDIDGVLNDEGEQYKKGVIIEEKRIERLSRIVEATNAEIVMSSSWRFSYRDFKESNFQNGDDELVLLQEYFDKYNIVISDFTPDIDSEPFARPVEIRHWLLDKSNTKSFVILDDDTFGLWNWLKEYFVLTRTKIENEYDEFRKGLEDIHVKKAIKILNKYD